ncbi:transmembrane protease serine 9 [Galendromus occidentalis]|uniref:limulus clotting factor C n=1 Tax=Galendromus occidentalis TaxID=34638 RepID=A0AAJ6QTZ2_9ACAR|nr:transmembrane protease serine 9 [Galendromus occidentalis]
MKPIIGGKVTHKNEFPWQIALRIRQENQWFLHCGATLLNSWWILTAAHCFRNPLDLDKYQIVAGAQNLLEGEETTQYRGLRQFILHPGWNATLLMNDLALLRVDQPFRLNQEAVAPACLPDENGSDDENEFCYATGWGAAGMEGDSPIHHNETLLYKSKLPLIPRSECDARYVKKYDIRISPKQLCAGRNKDSGTCVGDSGGPLSCETGGTYKVVGVTSFGGRHCNTNVFPDVFTRVSAYRRWILDHIVTQKNRLFKTTHSVRSYSRKMRASRVLAVSLAFVASASASAVACGKRNSYSLFMDALQLEDSNYIVGGTRAVKNEFPWQVSIQAAVRSGLWFKKKQHICGGSIINDRWILTAAHCILDNVRLNDYYIVAGSQYVMEEEDTTQVRKPEKIIVHPGWDPEYVQNDIALIKLSQPLYLSARSVAPICLPKSSDNNKFHGKTCTASGWGAVVDRGQSSSVLLKVNLPIVPNNLCSYLYSNVVNSRLNENHICAGDIHSDGSGVCQGDSGGPLVCEEDGIYTLAGLTSFGVVCGASEFPAVFTRISSFRSWIDNNIE